MSLTALRTAELAHEADSDLEKVVLGCGGKNPAVVFDDTENLDHVAESVAHAAFYNTGQNCSAPSHLIVRISVKAPLMERTDARLRDWQTGDPLDPTTHTGPFIETRSQKSVANWSVTTKGRDILLNLPFIKWAKRAKRPGKDFWPRVARD